MVQKRAIRLICNVEYRARCRPSFAMLRVLTLPSHYVYFTLCFARRSRNSLVTNNNIHYNNTRNKYNFGGQYFRYASSQKDNMIVFVNQIV